MKCAPASHVRGVIDQIMATGEWEWAGRQNSGHGLIVHTSGATINYPLHKSSDRNVSRKILHDAEQVMGRQIVHRTGRKRSRRAIVNPLDVRRAEAVIQTEINDLLVMTNELAVAIHAAATTALNGRSAASQRFLTNLKRQYAETSARLAELWPEWKDSA